MDRKNNDTTLAVLFLLPYVDGVTTVEVLRHIFGPLSMSGWTDDLPDSIREGRVGRAMRTDLEIDPTRDAVADVGGVGGPGPARLMGGRGARGQQSLRTGVRPRHSR